MITIRWMEVVGATLVLFVNLYNFIHNPAPVIVYINQYPYHYGRNGMIYSHFLTLFSNF
nr:MAG TPA: hypothetical protein [Caudoviricetes sp.]